ncbi:unnamed protein product [Ostreobium quekettii]|uniref:Uncharacterized protein n=1 Tax=Ostreobium quekettii TaxID=121088 RepID=A0A8S1J510_9CHLO|nr:unnamed protein product [Ostreobium quekettii]
MAYWPHIPPCTFCEWFTHACVIATESLPGVGNNWFDSIVASPESNTHATVLLLHLSYPQLAFSLSRWEESEIVLGFCAGAETAASCSSLDSPTSPPPYPR